MTWTFSVTSWRIHWRKWPKTLKNGQIWPKNGLLTLKMTFSQLSVNRKGVDNGLIYIPVNFQPH